MARSATDVDARDVQKLLRRAIRPRSVKFNLAAKPDDVGNQAGKVGNGNVLAASHIEKLQIRIKFHNKDASIGEIVDSQKLASWRPGTPNGHAFTADELGLGENVAAEQLERDCLADDSCRPDRKASP